jgi:hypothetical protein
VQHLMGRAQRVNSRPFSDWLADVQRQCARRTGDQFAANGASERYWQAAYWAGLTAWDAADTFVTEERGGR